MPLSDYTRARNAGSSDHSLGAKMRIQDRRWRVALERARGNHEATRFNKGVTQSASNSMSNGFSLPS